MIREAMAKVVAGANLSAAEMEAAAEEVLAGEASPAQIAGLLVALRMKGETATELAAAARTMRAHAIPVKLSRCGPTLDTCGTGGDGHGTFNISTLAAIVVAACGVTVAKHGNRAASSKCGSADVLEALGVNLDIDPAQVGECIEQVGIGFMFAAAHHPAMRHAAPVRSQLGIRTMFNFLGPLSNPAGVSHQLLGVGDPSKLELLAEVLAILNIEAAWVVAGAEGLDEVALSGETRLAAVADGQVQLSQLSPVEFGLQPAPLSALVGGDAAENADICHAILAGERGPRRDAVVLNAAAALCACQVERDKKGAAIRAQAALDSGAAARKLRQLVTFTQACGTRRVG